MADRPDFEMTLERRLQAYAASGVHPTSVGEVVRTTMWATTTPLGRTSRRGGPRRSLWLVGLAAILLLGTAAGAALVARWPRTVEGVFVEGPSLDAGRRIMNALTLPDGRVVAGVIPEGVDNGLGALRCPTPCRPHLAILDPRLDRFATPAFPPQALGVEAMALLIDGRVLLVSGADQDGRLRPAWVYDPSADTFEATGTPLTARTWPFLVSLEDGRVLVAGGEADGPLAAAEVYDPATGRFSATGPMTRPRSFGTTATRLDDGRVLVVGGGAEVGPSAELYDPTTGTFTPTGDMLTARGGFHSATRLDDGLVLLVGGLVPDPDDPTLGATATAAAEVYDPATGTFAAVGSMAQPRFLHAASILPDGRVLVAGGSDALHSTGEPSPTATAELFDPSTGTFSPTGSLRHPRLWPVAAATDRRVIVLGDLDPVGTDTTFGATSEWFE